jgi:hypothetical protein
MRGPRRLFGGVPAMHETETVWINRGVNVLHAKPEFGTRRHDLSIRCALGELSRCDVPRGCRPPRQSHLQLSHRRKRAVLHLRNRLRYRHLYPGGVVGRGTAGCYPVHARDEKGREEGYVSAELPDVLSLTSLPTAPRSASRLPERRPRARSPWPVEADPWHSRGPLPRTRLECQTISLLCSCRQDDTDERPEGGPVHG